MAPEVALKEPYDKECDVFSFSMLLWEIASFQFAYPNYSVKDYYINVCKNNQRPSIPTGSAWPAILKSIVTEGWGRNPQKRPTMKRVGMLLRGLLQDISNDDSITNRTQHMLNKSRKSWHDYVGTPGGSGGGGGGGNGSVSGGSGGSGGSRGSTPSSSSKPPPINSRRRSGHHHKASSHGSMPPGVN